MAGNISLELSGATPETVFNEAIQKGVSASDAAILVSGWIFHNFGKTKRTFNYVQGFPAVEPQCVSKFARSFVHNDWVDGESAVQAGQTVGEEGFNARFHTIEKDLDSVKTDLAQAFACLAEMRQSMRTLLDEIRAELNRLNSDVFDASSSGTVPFRPLPGVSPPFGNLVEGGDFLGTTKFNDKAVSIWKTQQGVLMLPAVNTIGVTAVEDTRLKAAPDLAKHFGDVASIGTTFAGRPVTKKELVDKFGNDRTENGMTVKDIVNILPDDASFPTLNDMVNAVAERQAAAVRTTSGASAAITSVFGLDPSTTVTTVGQAPVEKLDTIPAQAKQVLVRNGIDTVDKLAQADPVAVNNLMQKEGVTTSLGSAASWTATAKTLSFIK